jgi:hypothetical protein
MSIHPVVTLTNCYLSAIGLEYSCPSASDIKSGFGILEDLKGFWSKINLDFWVVLDTNIFITLLTKEIEIFLKDNLL